MKYNIKRAEKCDAPVIARGIATALHIGEHDAAISLDNDDWTLWQQIFTELAARDDTQYSYRNTLKAVDDNGEILGLIITYDGALLHSLRVPFFETVKKIAGEDLSSIPDETSADEWYFDTLAVLPGFRHKGIGKALLQAALDEACTTGKPAGLLVDKNNPTARRLYESVGFEYVDDRPFADVMMDHMQARPKC